MPKDDSKTSSLESVGDWFLVLLEEVNSFFIRNTAPIINLMAHIAAFLSPLIVGWLGDFLLEIDKNNQWKDWAEWKKHWHIVFPIFTWMISAVWLKYNRETNNNRNLAYKELQYLYNDLFRAYRETSDFRCTIWTVARRDRDGIPTKMQQWTDYYPAQSKSSKGLKSNAKAGRTFRVYRGHKDKEPVGIIGKCILDTFSDEKSVVSYSEVPSDKTLTQYLADEFNFKRHHAKVMRADRLSFMCISLIDEGSKKLQAIVYFDSRDRNSFVSPMRKRIEKYMPRVLGSLTN